MRHRTLHLYPATRIVRRAARMLPAAPVNRLMAALVNRLLATHPDALARLAPIAGKQFRIEATDIGLAFNLSVGLDAVAVTLARESALADVHILGQMPMLVAVLQGQLDGDAVFFSRDLTVTGDTEALLTLRNALDSVDIDIEAEIYALFGRGEPLARRVAADARQMHHFLKPRLNLVVASLFPTPARHP